MTAPIKLEDAGLYSVPGSDFWIVRTEGWEGPRGGMQHRWEIAYVDPSDSRGNLNIESYVEMSATLRDAREVLASYMETLDSPYYPFGD